MALRRSTRKSTNSVANDVAPASSPVPAAKIKDSPAMDSRHQQKRTRASHTFVANSSDQESDTIEAIVPKGSTQTRLVLKAVSIPASKTQKTPVTRGRLSS
ncbi:hypothetical protein COCHEDRAFT_117199, partial [Bipolaris maydis C5]